MLHRHLDKYLVLDALAVNNRLIELHCLVQVGDKFDTALVMESLLMLYLAVITAIRGFVTNAVSTCGRIFNVICRRPCFSKSPYPAGIQPAVFNPEQSPTTFSDTWFSPRHSAVYIIPSIRQISTSKATERAFHKYRCTYNTTVIRSPPDTSSSYLPNLVSPACRIVI